MRGDPLIGTAASSWILASRPKTLFAAVSPVLIGTAIALAHGVFHLFAAMCALAGAVLIQIGTNFFNDYADFTAGVDTEERLGPTRAVQSGLISAPAMKRAAIFAFALAFLSGVYLIFRAGWPIAVIGIVSIACGFLYTAGRFSLSRTGSADLFVFIFFGPVAVAGTYYVQSLAWPLPVWVAGIAPGLLCVAILIVNNIRDVEQDRAAHKKTLVVRFGRGFGIRAWIACFAGAGGVTILSVVIWQFPVLILFAVAVLASIVPSARILLTTPVEQSGELNPVLESTARVLFLFSLLYSAAWLAGS